MPAYSVDYCVYFDVCFVYFVWLVCFVYSEWYFALCFVLAVVDFVCFVSWFAGFVLLVDWFGWKNC